MHGHSKTASKLITTNDEDNDDSNDARQVPPYRSHTPLVLISFLVSPILEYKGYLKHVVIVRSSDYNRLIGEHKLNDVIVDMLIRWVSLHIRNQFPHHVLSLSHAYSQAFEEDSEVLSKTVVFPVAFFTRLKSKAIPAASSSKDVFEYAHELVAAYDADIWRSELVIIPAKFKHRWILLLVYNANQAKPERAMPLLSKALQSGDKKPDSRPFCILSLDPEGGSQSKRRNIIREYLQHEYLKRTGEALEAVEDFEAHVSYCIYCIPLTYSYCVLQCPFQLDPTSCGLHTVSHVEAVLSPGVPELIRKHAQVKHLCAVRLRDL